MSSSVQDQKDTTTNNLFYRYSTHSYFPNTVYFLEIVGAQKSGDSNLPTYLGLTKQTYEQLVKRHFPGIGQFQARNEKSVEIGTLRQELLELREAEAHDIVEQLLEHRANQDVSEEWMAAIIAAGCLGTSHLWKDLGLPSRNMLKQLMFDNFPTLAAKNDNNMRWKKFIYRQLCENQGHFICRSPSCETCPTYEECFGDES